MPTPDEIITNTIREYLENGGRESTIKPVLLELKERYLLNESTANYFYRILSKHRKAGGNEELYGDCLKHAIIRSKYDEELFGLISTSLHSYRVKGLYGARSELRMKENGLMPTITNDKLGVSGTKKFLELLIHHHNEGGNQLELAQIMNTGVNALERYEHEPYFFLVSATPSLQRGDLAHVIHRKLLGEGDDPQYHEVNRRASLFVDALKSIKEYSKDPAIETEKLFEEMRGTQGPIERPLINRARARWGFRYN